jgi:hypothetical protein
VVAFFRAKFWTGGVRISKATAAITKTMMRNVLKTILTILPARLFLFDVTFFSSIKSYRAEV